MAHRICNLVEDSDSDKMIGKEIDLIYSTKDNEEDSFQFPDIHIPYEEELDNKKTTTSKGVTHNPDFCSEEDLDTQGKPPATRIKMGNILILCFSQIPNHPFTHLNQYFLSIPIENIHSLLSEEKDTGQKQTYNKESHQTNQKGKTITPSLFCFHQEE